MPSDASRPLASKTPAGAFSVRGDASALGTVWIVEDSPLEAEMARRALGTEHHVELFSDGASLIERITHDKPPAAIVLDWHMPGLTGLETCQYLLAHFDPMALPILMLTVQGSKDDVVEGLNSGANDYLTKPYDVAELQARVRTLVRAAKLSEMQTWRGRLLALDADLGDATTRSTTLDALGLATSRSIRDRLELAAVSLYVVREGHELELLSHAGERAVEAEIGVAAEVLRGGEALTRDAFSLQLHARPLAVRQQTIGVLVASSKRPLSTDLLNALDGVVDVIALGIERAKADAERQVLLARAEAARADAEQANRSKDEFLAMVSHELRTPLNAIGGWTKILLRTPDMPERTLRALETIDRNVRSQTQLIDDLLDISRIVAGKLRLNVESVELVQVVELALDAVRFAADAKGVRLQAVLDSSPSHIVGDADRLQQIVWNLLSNAIKFTPKGGRVRIELQHLESSVELRVEDSGQGIPPEFLPHVFDRFRQAEGTISRSKGGLGLGLAIVRHLAELHGGTVSAVSEGEGKGAAFVVRLPLSPLRATTRSEHQPTRTAASTPPATTFECPKELVGLKVLVVEDEPDARSMLQDILETCESIVFTAASAAEGMEILRRERPDVLLSDVGMPGEDGFSFLKRVRALPREEGGTTPAIALTAYARAEDRTRALVAGFNTHVAKPIDPSELLLVIRNVAGRFS